jgi:hypothetical protein
MALPEYTLQFHLVDPPTLSFPEKRQVLYCKHQIRNPMYVFFFNGKQQFRLFCLFEMEDVAEPEYVLNRTKIS